MCLHGALFSISFNLICNTTTFKKKWFYLLTPYGVEGVCKDIICACMVLYALFPFNLIFNMITFRK